MFRVDNGLPFFFFLYPHEALMVSNFCFQSLRLKAISDQATGWFTLVDKFGTAYAEKFTELYLAA